MINAIYHRDDSPAKICAIIVAAGKGVRSGLNTPKQYEKLHDVPLLSHCINAFLKCDFIDNIQVVIGEGQHRFFTDCLQYITIPGQEKLMPPVVGGDTRQESAHVGLMAIHHLSPDYVYIHDAARPFIKGELIKSLFRKIHDDNIDDNLAGCVPVLDMTDSILSVRGGMRYMARDSIKAVQTPQIFKLAPLYDAHNKAKGKKIYTDDASILLSQRKKIAYIKGDKDNVKLTFAEDFIEYNMMPTEKNDSEIKFADTTQGRCEYRTTTGMDVHAFEEGDGVTICGIKIPHNKKLKGHSDADVALHALCDAMFASIALGDIGVHFPPSDKKWKGANSKIFVDFALKKLAEKKANLTYVDITIIAEFPKISPHYQVLRDNLSSLLFLPADRISIKATTTEKLGFLGRGEGMAATASVTISLPIQS